MISSSLCFSPLLPSSRFVPLLLSYPLLFPLLLSSCSFTLLLSSLVAFCSSSHIRHSYWCFSLPLASPLSLYIIRPHSPSSLAPLSLMRSSYVFSTMLRSSSLRRWCSLILLVLPPLCHHLSSSPVYYMLLFSAHCIYLLSYLYRCFSLLITRSYSLFLSVMLSPSIS